MCGLYVWLHVPGRLADTCLCVPVWLCRSVFSSYDNLMNVDQMYAPCFWGWPFFLGGGGGSSAPDPLYFDFVYTVFSHTLVQIP